MKNSRLQKVLTFKKLYFTIILLQYFFKIEGIICLTILFHQSIYRSSFLNFLLTQQTIDLSFSKYAKGWHILSPLHGKTYILKITHTKNFQQTYCSMLLLANSGSTDNTHTKSATSFTFNS